MHLPAPGMADQLADEIARIVAGPIDRTRPLWQAYVIDGLHDGRWAQLSKYHHATIDGAAGQLLLQTFTDVDLNTAPPGEAQEWHPALHRAPWTSCDLQT